MQQIEHHFSNGAHLIVFKEVLTFLNFKSALINSSNYCIFYNLYSKIPTFHSSLSVPMKFQVASSYVAIFHALASIGCQTEGAVSYYWQSIMASLEYRLLIILLSKATILLDDLIL